MSALTREEAALRLADQRPSPGPGRLLRAGWYLLLIALVAAGGVAIAHRTAHGLAATNLTSITPWGAWIAFYIYFVGLSAGAFLLSSLIYVFGMARFERLGRMALLTALVAMIVALTFVLLDLGRMERALSALVYFNWLSPLAWEMRFYVIYILLLAAELWFAMRADLVRRAERSRLARWLSFGSRSPDTGRDHRMLRILGTIGVPIAIFGVHGGTGTIFAIVKARGMWFSALTPIVFIVSALVSGTALLALLYILRQKALKRPVDAGMVADLGKLLGGFLLVDLGLLFYEFLVPLLSMAPHETSVVHLMMEGPYAWTFWILQLGIGMVAPAILLMTRLRESVPLTALACLMVVVGIVGVRFNIVVPPLIEPVLQGLPAGQYFPNAVEWWTSAGIIAMGLLLFSVAADLLPVDEEVHEIGGTAHD